jgi:hypothetical protein
MLFVYFCVFSSFLLVFSLVFGNFFIVYMFLENQALIVRSIVYLLRSSAFEPIPSLSRTCARFRRSCVRARTFLTNNSAVIRLIAPLLQSSALAYTATYLHVCDQSYCPVLKRTSAD